MCFGCDTSYIVSVHIQCQASIYTLSLCHRHSWRAQLAKQETLTPPRHLVSPLVCRGPWMSTVVLYWWWHSDSASVHFIFYMNTAEDMTKVKVFCDEKTDWLMRWFECFHVFTIMLGDNNHHIAKGTKTFDLSVNDLQTYMPDHGLMTGSCINFKDSSEQPVFRELLI